MTLHWSPRSPFVRKVMIVLHETGLLDRVTCVRNVVGMSQLNEQVMHDNPLNKIPTLVLEDGRKLYDSRVICDFLDELHGGAKLIPADRARYIQAMTWQALGDGFIDALLLWRNWYIDRGLSYDCTDDPFLNAFNLKCIAVLAALEAQAAELEAAPFGLGHISIGCALGQLDFRWAFIDWRSDHPALAQWYQRYQSRPSVIATMIRDDNAPSAP
ncbi:MULTISPECIES: glutathione S-transferase family protein [Pseudomonas]|uniref:glutathione S-transferase family protein n=1 Tax=Pseudomonas TaxID=286 RepID=UPI000E6AA714|nr:MULTISPECIES: glutathione S-transferase family protein [Pseudomonas]NSX19549.1 glutathione S-transferase [Pseudomonas putida]